MKNKQEQRNSFCSEPELGNHFPFYINGKISLEERKKIEEHLAVCKECREEVRLFLDFKAVGKDLFR
jgi:hypothetical protein